MIQQQVEEIKFQEVFITKSISIAQKTNKIRDWLVVLRAFQQNNLIQQKDKTIQQMHYKFILHEQFWLLQYENRIKAHHDSCNISQSQVKQIRQKDIDILFLGIEDGCYISLADKLEQLLISVLNKKEQKYKCKLRTNYVLAKLEKLSQYFKYNKNYFSGLRNYYISTFNTKKVRELYHKQLKQGYENHDIIYDQYTLWEQDKLQLSKSQLIYKKAKQAYDCDNVLISSHGSKIFRNPLDNIVASTQANHYYTLLQSSQQIKYSQFQCPAQLRQPLNQFQKLRYLRIFVLTRHELIQAYVQKLQKVYGEDDEKLLKYYKGLLRVLPAQKIQPSYLRYMVRRINKHVYSQQDQQYNKSWSENVTVFRNEILMLINKDRSKTDIQLINKIKSTYYEFWANIETSLVKDKQSVTQIYQAFLQSVTAQYQQNANSTKYSRSIVEVYYDYSQSLIKLGHEADAKQVLKRCINLYQRSKNVKLIEGNQKQENKNHKKTKQNNKKQKLKIIVLSEIQVDKAFQQYQQFLQIYGSIDDVIQFRKLLLERSNQLAKNNYQQINNYKQAINSNINNEQQSHYIKQTTNNKRQDDIKEPGQSKFSSFLRNKQKQKKQREVKKLFENGIHENESIHKQPSKRVKLSGDNEEIEASELKNTNNRYTIQIVPQQNIDPIQKIVNKQQNKKPVLHTDSGNTIFVKGFPADYRQQQIQNLIKHKQKIKQIRLIQRKGVYQNYCYIDMLNAEDAELQVQQNQHKNKYTIAISKPPSAYNEDKTLFLCGLPKTATVQKIKQLFSEQEQQGIVDIRLKLDEKRNIAYVDFQTIEQAKKLKDKYEKKSLQMDTKKIILKSSNSSNTSRNKKNFRVIILKQLAFKAKQKDLIQYFKDYQVDDVYIPQGQNGKSKGFAYVKFKKDEDFKKALQMKSGNVKGRKFQIQQSDRDLQRPKQKSNTKNQQQKHKNIKEPEMDNNYFSKLFK